MTIKKSDLHHYLHDMAQMAYEQILMELEIDSSENLEIYVDGETFSYKDVSFINDHIVELKFELDIDIE